MSERPQIFLPAWAVDRAGGIEKVQAATDKLFGGAFEVIQVEPFRPECQRLAAEEKARLGLYPYDRMADGDERSL